jgi:hypothetical protein
MPVLKRGETMKRVFPVVVLLAVCSVFGTAQATKTSSVEEPAKSYAARII